MKFKYMFQSSGGVRVRIKLPSHKINIVKRAAYKWR